MPVVRGQSVEGLPLKQVNSDSATESASSARNLTEAGFFISGCVI